MTSPPKLPLHIHLDHLSLSELPAGGEARLRREVTEELTRLLDEEVRAGCRRPLSPGATQAQRIADQIYRALPSRGQRVQFRKESR